MIEPLLPSTYAYYVILSLWNLDIIRAKYTTTMKERTANPTVRKNIAQVRGWLIMHPLSEAIRHGLARIPLTEIRLQSRYV